MSDQPPTVALDTTTPTPPQRTPARLGIVPTSVEEAYRLAQMMARSELVPKSYRNKPEDVIVAIQMGAEVGLAPMQAIQSIAVINGRPSLWGDGLLALIMASPQYADHQEYFVVAGAPCDTLTADDLKSEATAAVCTFVRHGKATPVTRSFSIGQARRADLLGKDGPWKQHPARMLQMRARAFAARDTFPDVLRGIAAAEESHEIRDVTPHLEAPVPIVRRMSDRPEVVKGVSFPDPVKAFPEAPYAWGPFTVKAVMPSPGGAVVTFADGREAWADDPRFAAMLSDLVGTDHRVRVSIDTASRVVDVEIDE